MLPDNKVLKEFLYVYLEMLKFLKSSCKKDIHIGAPMVLLMSHIITIQMDKKAPITKKEMLSDNFMQRSTFYRLFDMALQAGLLEAVGKDTFKFTHQLPVHLQVLDEIHNKEIFISS